MLVAKLDFGRIFGRFFGQFLMLLNRHPGGPRAAAAGQGEAQDPGQAQGPDSIALIFLGPFFGPFLPAAKPAGLCLANVTHLLDTWLLGALDAFRDMLAQVSELARMQYDVS